MHALLVKLQGGDHRSIRAAPEVRNAPELIHVLLTDGGALTAAAVRLRKERRLVPGLVIARHIDYWDRTVEVEISLLDDGQLRIVIPPTPAGGCRRGT